MMSLSATAGITRKALSTIYTLTWSAMAYAPGKPTRMNSMAAQFKQCGTVFKTRWFCWYAPAMRTLTLTCVAGSLSWGNYQDLIESIFNITAYILAKWWPWSRLSGLVRTPVLRVSGCTRAVYRSCTIKTKASSLCALSLISRKRWPVWKTRYSNTRRKIQHLNHIAFIKEIELIAFLSPRNQSLISQAHATCCNKERRDYSE